MQQFSEDILISAPPETIFAVYRNVSNWRHWDPDIASASLVDGFVQGATGERRPTQGPAAEIELSEVDVNRAFTMTAKLPLCTLRFEHELQPEQDVTRAIHRVSFDGPLASFFGRVVGNQMRKSLPAALQGLKAISERRTA